MNIRFLGTKKQKTVTELVILALPLTGNEATDRIIIQDALDANTGMGNVMYEGNTVYPKKRLLNELKKLRKSNDLTKMSDKMYQFLIMNFDIAHSDKGGFIAYYDESFSEMENAILKRPVIPSWKTDVQRIIAEFGGVA